MCLAQDQAQHFIHKFIGSFLVFLPLLKLLNMSGPQSSSFLVILLEHWTLVTCLTSPFPHLCLPLWPREGMEKKEQVFSPIPSSVEMPFLSLRNWALFSKHFVCTQPYISGFLVPYPGQETPQKKKNWPTQIWFSDTLSSGCFSCSMHLSRGFCCFQWMGLCGVSLLLLVLNQTPSFHLTWLFCFWEFFRVLMMKKVGVGLMRSRCRKIKKKSNFSPIPPNPNTFGFYSTFKKSPSKASMDINLVHVFEISFLWLYR